MNISYKKSIWKVNGNKILSNNKPVILEWNNDEGVIFKKKIELDNKYLFKISQEVKNNTISIISIAILTIIEIT